MVWLGLLLVLGLLVAACPSLRNYYGHRDNAQIRWDIPYLAQSQEKHHQLDLYLPKNQTEPFPLVIFIHGGLVKPMGRRMLQPVTGLHGSVGASLTHHGIAAAIVDYRQHPNLSSLQEPLDDVAAAIGYIVQNATDWGADPSKIFVVGHSMGAFLSARLAFDPSLLQRAGLSEGSIRGFVSVAGPYDLSSFCRGSFGQQEPKLTKRMTQLAGGEEGLKSFSPIAYLNANHTPFLLVVGLNDDPSLIEQHYQLKAALEPSGQFTAVELTGENHMSPIVRLGTKRDQLMPHLLTFFAEAQPATQPSQP